MKQIDSLINKIKNVTNFVPQIGLILGSGLGEYAGKIENPVFIQYEDLPGFPVSSVSGHKNRFVMGTCYGKKVIAMQGRFHYYEGYNQNQIAMPIRLMKKLGVKIVLLTNAAGGLNKSFKPGDLMLITDHINFSGANPLRGENDDEFGQRFPDMSEIYDKILVDEIEKTMKKSGIEMKKGTYIMFSGPSYETPAEVRMAQLLGGDAVGMSTVPEAIAASHCGIKVIGISCITNMASGITSEKLNHKEVVETANLVKDKFTKVLDVIIEDIIQL